MQPEVTLTVYDDATGRERQVNVRSRRFTIGRLPENDLMIDDSNLSRRHAVIDNFAGSVLVSDCGSQNGTLVNGKPVVGAVELRDGDIITLGGAKDITVNVLNGSSPTATARGATENYAAQSGPSTAMVNPSNASAQSRTSQAGASAPAWLGIQAISAAAVVLILVVAGLLLAPTHRSGAEPKLPGQQSNVARRQQTVLANENSNAGLATENNENIPASDTPVSHASAGDNSGVGSDDLDLIEKYALIVMRKISSNDDSATLSRKVLSEINEVIKRYQGSSLLRDELRVMRQRGILQLPGTSRSSDVKPALVILAGLAKMDRDGERGDPVAVAQGMLPTLSRLCHIFGTELANDSLLVIAAYDQGPGGTTHPLQIAMSDLAKSQPESPATIRTVWYLHDHKKISSQSYDLVLRFLAIGVVAQDPRHFGVDAEPLSF